MKYPNGDGHATFADEREGMEVQSNGCARCHGEHTEPMFFEKLEHPVPDADGDFTHWAPCPANNQPILLRVVPTDD